MNHTTYHVASINIRCDTSVDLDNGWEYRKKNLLSMIEYYSWDLIGLQEVKENQLKYLASHPDYSYEGIGRDGGADEHGPVFYKKDRFDRIDGGTFWLSETPDSPSKGWDADYPRICTWVRLLDKRSGEELMAVNTHLDHVGEEARFQGASMIAEWLDQHAQGLPCILTGDFNASPKERCYSVLTGKLTDTRRASESPHFGPHGTFTNFNYNLPWSKLEEIDYIFTSSHFKTLRSRTLVDSFDQRYPSDHFPISAVLKL